MAKTLKEKAKQAGLAGAIAAAAAGGAAYQDTLTVDRAECGQIIKEAYEHPSKYVESVVVRKGECTITVKKP